jgi:hypothetical protein
MLLLYYTRVEHEAGQEKDQQLPHAADLKIIPTIGGMEPRPKITLPGRGAACL